MIVAHVEFAVCATMPVPRNPPLLAVFANRISRMIAPGDTVCIISISDNLDNTLGRVIGISDMATVHQIHIPIHPDCHIVDNQTGPLLKLQLILSQPSSKLIHPDAAWPIENEESMMATRGLTHVAHINFVVWISLQLIVGLISVFHTSDCINHTYGAITGREYAYFTCSNAVYWSFSFQVSHSFNSICIA